MRYLHGENKRQILESLSLLVPWGKHPAVSRGRMDRVGAWLLRTNEFEKWYKLPARIRLFIQDDFFNTGTVLAALRSIL